jgi:hypothetical protein
LLADLLDLPPKPLRSKLEPHRELIRELRRKGRTYREVSRLFAERLGLQVAPAPCIPSSKSALVTASKFSLSCLLPSCRALSRR